MITKLKKEIWKTILEEVCKEIEVKPSDIVGKNRYHDAIKARFILCKLANDAGLDFYEISDLIKRNRCTIYNAIDRYNDYYYSNPLFRRNADNIISKLKCLNIYG